MSSVGESSSLVCGNVREKVKGVGVGIMIGLLRVENVVTDTRS
jgi:hypothetical protein